MPKRQPPGDACPDIERGLEMCASRRQPTLSRPSSLHTNPARRRSQRYHFGALARLRASSYESPSRGRAS
eukprot:4300016-Prymnesium_polylepis.1